MRKPYEPIEDGRQTERFVDALRKIVAVPKKDVDKQIEKERKEREKNKKRKA